MGSSCESRGGGRNRGHVGLIGRWDAPNFPETLQDLWIGALIGKLQAETRVNAVMWAEPATAIAHHGHEVVMVELECCATRRGGQARRGSGPLIGVERKVTKLVNPKQ